MPRALITGISGQDGTYLAQSLLESGFDVHGVVRSIRAGDASALDHPSLTVHEVDLIDATALRKLVFEVNPDEIYNLAAVSSVMQSWQAPVSTTLINAMPLVSILEAVWDLDQRRASRIRIVQASSAELFGQTQQSPQNESTLIRPSSPYGAAKAFGHHLVNVYRSRGLHASSCILFNHESPLRSEEFVTRKITAGVARISRGQQSSLELGNLTAKRDWGWAPDYVQAMRLAARAEAGDDYVIATGVTHSIGDFLQAAFHHVGIEDWTDFVTVNPAFIRPVDPVEQVGDASKARTLLGWTTTKSFEEIVVAMVDADLEALDRTGSVS